MSTRCVILFGPVGERHCVYMHCDGYPLGAQDAIGATIASGKAWPLPRFEPDEFAAAFVAVNKASPGHIRLVDRPSLIGDAAYWHYVTHDERGVRVESYSVNDSGSRLTRGDIRGVATFDATGNRTVQL